MIRHERTLTKDPTQRASVPPRRRILFHALLEPEHRRMLRKALIEALARSGAEAWRAIVTPVLVYESPVLATWSLRLRLIPEQGEPVLIVLDQEHQTPEHVSAALVAALAQRVP